eukprot:447708-Pleurochrysis_carterae.AAC.1
MVRRRGVCARGRPISFREAMDDNNNTGWSIRDKALAPDDHFSSNVLMQMGRAMGVGGFAEKLCNELVAPYGAVEVVKLKKLYYSVAKQAVERCGFNAGLVDSLA